MKYNKDFTGEKYRDIAKVLNVEGAETLTIEEVRDAACAAIDQMSKDVGIPATISELGVKAEDITKIAADALKDVCTPGNPRDTSLEDIIEIYSGLM
jgi:lactaldehyde reductase